MQAVVQRQAREKRYKESDQHPGGYNGGSACCGGCVVRCLKTLLINAFRRLEVQASGGIPTATCHPMGPLEPELIIRDHHFGSSMVGECLLKSRSEEEGLRSPNSPKKFVPVFTNRPRPKAEDLRREV